MIEHNHNPVHEDARRLIDDLAKTRGQLEEALRRREQTKQRLLSVAKSLRAVGAAGKNPREIIESARAIMAQHDATISQMVEQGRDAIAACGVPTQ